MEMRRVLALVMVLCLLVGQLTATARAAEKETVVSTETTEEDAEIVNSGTCGENVTWTLGSNGLLTISGTGPMEEYYSGSSPFAGFGDQVKAIVIEEGVTSIGNYTFMHLYLLESLVIAESVTAIGEFAFYNCYKLKSVTIPAGVTEIGRLAFCECDGVETMLVDENNPAYCTDDTSVLYNKSMTKLIWAPCNLTGLFAIPDSVTVVDSWAFENCVGLMEVTIPADIAELSNGVFSGCSNLAEVTFAGNAPTIESNTFSGVTATVHYPFDNDSWTSDMMQNYDGTLTWESYGLLASGDCGEALTWALSESGRLIISGSGEMANYSETAAPWSEYTVTSVVIESGVTSISSGAFAGCAGLTEIVFKGDAPTIGETAFADVTATAFYPEGNTTWTKDTMQSYGGSLTWEETLKLPYPVIQRDTVTIAQVPADGYAYFQFKPEVTEEYFFCSMAEGVDTRGDFYDSNMNQLLGNNDYSDLNFGVYYTLEAGVTYILRVGSYSGASSFPVMLQAQHDYGADNLCTICGAVKLLTGACGNNISWMLDTTGELTVSGSGAMYDYSWGQAPWFGETITSLVIEDGVTGVGNSAFVSLSEVQRIEIPESVTSIGESAFSACEKLTKVEIPSSVTSIGSSAFAGCTGLVTISIPATVAEMGENVFVACNQLTDAELCEGLVSIGDGMFMYCSALATITIPDSVTNIGSSAFCGCSALETVSVSANVTAIGGGAFASCSNLDGIWVDANNTAYSSDSEGILFNKSQTVLMQVPCVLSGEYTIPSTVTKIDGGAFSGCKEITSVVIPEGVTNIGRSAFAGCVGLETIQIPESVTEIGVLAFSGCTALTSVTIPSNVTDIGWYAFDACTGLTEVIFTCDVPTIGSDAFNGITATIYYPADNETWTEDVMQQYGGTLTWVAYEPAAEVVASGSCGDDLTWTLDESGLLTISGAGEMTSAPWLTDYAGSITAVYMEPGITSIYDRAFSSCSNLTEVTIPEGVTAIGNSAFYGCLNLPELTLPQSLRTIGKSAFSDCDALTEIVIPEGVTSIPLDAFAGCYRLASVTVPSTVTEIDQCAFLSCPSLKSFVFPEGIGIVEFELFMNCYTLESVSIPSSVCVIKGCAFQDCDRLGEVTIPDCVFSIGDYAFYKSGLTALRVGPGGQVDRTLGANTIPSIPDGIGRYSFSSCSSLEEVEIGPEINEIGEYAFAYSTLTQCTFLGDIPAIDATAFTGVTATVYYPVGNATYTEETMLDYGGTLTWVAYGEAEDTLFSLSGTSVSLGDSLDMSFFMESANVTEDCYAVITRYYADGREDQVVTVPYSDWSALEDGTLYVTYSGIAAKEMGDYVTVEIYDGSGSAISELYVDSVKSYAMRMLGKEEVIADEELRTLYVDMLNYGAAAQAQFGYNETMPANDLLTDEQKAYATASYKTESNLVSGTGRAGTTLTLKSRIALDFIFSNSAIGTDYTGLYAVAVYTDHYGNEVEVRIDTIKTYSSSCGYVSVPGLAVADYGQAVTCTVYDADGNALAWATDSMEGYAHRMAGKLPEIVETIVKFGVSSYNYFH